MTKKVGIGFIGTGFAERVQMPAFKMVREAELVSVASGKAANARSAAESNDISHWTGDWRETIDNEGVDLVCITTPPVLHREMTLYAFERGKHVLCEKPMAMNVGEAEGMIAAAKRVGKLALIDHELRFLPNRRHAYTMLRDGAIGKVQHAKYTFRAPHRGDPTTEWDWWSDESKGGGTLGAINSHVIDSFNWFLGTEIDSVLCQLHTHIKERPYDGGTRKVTTDDEANMLLRFADSALTADTTGLVSVSMIEGPEYINRIEFFGEKGFLRVDHTGTVHHARRGDSNWECVFDEKQKGVDGVPESGFPAGFVAFAQEIVDAIAEGRTSIEHAATFEDGLSVQRVLDAARRSSEQGKVEKPRSTAAGKA